VAVVVAVFMECTQQELLVQVAVVQEHFPITLLEAELLVQVAVVVAQVKGIAITQTVLLVQAAQV